MKKGVAFLAAVFVFMLSSVSVFAEAASASIHYGKRSATSGPVYLDAGHKLRIQVSNDGSSESAVYYEVYSGWNNTKDYGTVAPGGRVDKLKGLPVGEYRIYIKCKHGDRCRARATISD
ncbi:hypothetical protein [Thermoflavimicrobium dichotomicum]|uniref:Uncharacterized protein n=1 Tax=Thermoflavimicrobium dichotomicum TaxID=46223 RepID=A0A1I3R9H1_9BACL|nr:hypothetical protein [Thermoflavimicrobium dichotomicum]SFJ43253.1 hypothetical protein SAMN05421852_109102 [Thermoflavimicrobium dichotomicum]